MESNALLERPTGIPTVKCNSFYTIQSIPGKGQGMVATSTIPKGTRIISESPIFKLPGLVENDNLMEILIAKELKRLSKDKQQAFFSLHNAHTSNHGPFVGIAKTNGLPLGAGATAYGVFLEASRINHACTSNAQNTWNSNLDQLTIHAVKEIEEGQEITISYLCRSEKYAVRQLMLKAKFRFDCSCELCSLPPAQRQQSDQRFGEITRLDDLIADGVSIVSTPVTCLYNVRTLLRLLEEEGVADARIGRTYYDALQIAIANGDQARAKVFAERAHAARVVCEGEDSPEIVDLKRLAARPSEHELYGTSMRWKSGLKSIPKDLGEKEFEKWLWKSSKH